MVPLKISRCAENEFDTDRDARLPLPRKPCMEWDSGVRNFLFHLSFFPYLFLIVAIFISSPVSTVFFSLSHLMCCFLSEVCKLLALLNQIASKPNNHFKTTWSSVTVPLFYECVMINDANNHEYMNGGRIPCPQPQPCSGIWHIKLIKYIMFCVGKSGTVCEIVHQESRSVTFNG